MNLNDMRTNLIVLNNTLAPLITEPFFVLTTDEQREIRATITHIFTTIRNDLMTRAGKQATLLPLVDTILTLLKKSRFDEYEFTHELEKFLSHVVAKPSPIEKILLENINRVSERAKLFSQSEEVARAARASMTAEKIRVHDLKILENTMQMYALDYFLWMYVNLLTATPKRQTQIIYAGLEGAPALLSDALANDMLNKVVFDLYTEDIRQQMIADYFTYRKNFVGLTTNQSIPAEKLSAILTALKTYVLSLIDTSLAYNIKSFEHSLFKPMGELTDFLTIKKQLLAK